MSRSLRVASYASGHGLGHATRVCALAECLRDRGHEVFCCSNAPEMAFEGAIAKGAIYRKADVDAGVVQPTAYDVARMQTLENLEAFLARRDGMIAQEVEWLRQERIDLVLVDAPFIPCAAAKAAGLPALIVSNFTFDSCYSYLSVRADSSGTLHPEEEQPEPPVDPKRLGPIVDRTVADYRCAGGILRLPGAVPMPSFDTEIRLPAPQWVDLHERSFTPAVQQQLDSPPPLIVDMPLIVRPTAPDVYTPAFRRALLTRIGVPDDLQDPAETRILLVSFGGQVIPRPRSRQPSPSPSSDGLSSSPTATRVATLDTLLPRGWIAIVCGTAAFSEEDGFRNDMPKRFFACATGVHIPDLTAICDVVLGKLGYGTMSECLATATPFVAVPRPLFVEEYGLKRLMQKEGVLVELDRRSFEQGFWSAKVSEAWAKGGQGKEAARQSGKPVRGHGAGAVIADHVERWLATQNGSFS